MLAYIDSHGVEEDGYNDHLLDRKSGYFAALGASYTSNIQEIN